MTTQIIHFINKAEKMDIFPAPVWLLGDPMLVASSAETYSVNFFRKSVGPITWNSPIIS